MQDSGVPTKIGTVWAYSATSPYVNTIPVASSPTNGRASFTDGFPPACFIPVASGGAGPFGGDMNGIMQLVTQWLQWMQAGAPESYDVTFQTEIGGYPQNAIIASASTDGLWWLSTADNNVTDPDTGGAGWIGLPLSQWPNLIGSYAVDTGTANAGVVTLSPAPAAYASLTGAPLRVLKVALANTGNYTINVNGLGVKSLLQPNGEQIPNLGLPASGVFLAVYDGVNFQLLSAVSNTRTVLAASLDLYVATTGNDVTGSGTSVNPWATIQRAVLYVQNQLDLSSQVVTISINVGTYSAGASLGSPLLGQTSPGSLVFTTTGGTVTINGAGTCFSANGGASYTISGSFILNQTNISGSPDAAIAASGGGRVVLDDGTTFGTAAGVHTAATSGGEIAITGNYAISGSALLHWDIFQNGSLTVENAITVTISSGVGFSTTFASCNGCAVITATTVTFSGTATGTQYEISSNGVIDAGSTVFPGTGGSITSGGQLV